MTRKNAINKEQIVSKCFEMMNNSGHASVSARNLALELNVSHMTLFNYVSDMKEITKEVIIKGLNILNSRIIESLESGSNILEEQGVQGFCKIVAKEIIGFALEYGQIYLLIFDMDGSEMKGDKNIADAFTFIPRKLEEIFAGGISYKREYMIVIMALNSTILSVLKHRLYYTEDEIRDFINFCINKVF